MSEPQIAVDTNILMDAVKPDGAKDVEEAELVAARSVGALLLSDYMLVYTKKIEQEWQAKGVSASNRLLFDLLRLDRVKRLSPRSLSGAKVRECREHVDGDDQPFVLAASAIETKRKTLVTRDPKTTRTESRRYVKREFGVVVETAKEFVDGQDGS